MIDPNIVFTVEENASNFIDRVNLNLAEEGVTDKQGNPAEFKKLLGSPVYLMALAEGQTLTEWQERLRNANLALDVENCSDEQVLHLAELAGVVRKQASAPYITCTLYNAEENTIIINQRNSKAVDSVNNYNWYIGQNVSIASHTSVTVQFYCEKDIITTIPQGTTFTVTPTVEGAFEEFTCTADSESVAGTAQDSIATLRNKIVQGVQVYDPISKCQSAIESLAGIAKCSIWFNDSATFSETLPGGIVVPPRTAYICIQGSDVNNAIGKTYYDYLDVKTLQTADSFESFVHIGAKDMFVYYEQCSTAPIYIKVKVNANTSDPLYANYVKTALLPYSGQLAVGKNITELTVCRWLANLQNVDIVGVDVSDNGTTWKETTEIDVNSIAVFTSDNIVFEEV